MNVFRQTLSITRVLALAAAPLALSACASGVGGGLFGASPVDPASPAAPQMEALLAKETTSPRFIDIPPLPKDVRTPAAWDASLAMLEREGQELVLATAPGTWSLDGTDSFASRAQAQSTDGPGPSEQNQRDTDAFASELQRRATPPPLKR